MYKVFIENHPVCFEKGTNISSFLFDKYAPILKLEDYGEFCSEVASCSEVKLPANGNSPKDETFLSNFNFVEAAGGIVFYNELQKYLIIERLGKFDLPKGKLEKSESPELGATREIEEECGIKQLSLERKICDTYHTYNLYGGHFLKKTHWYFFNYDGNEKLTPQTEEDITAAIWMDENEIRKHVFSNTYKSILDVLNSVI